MGLIHIPQYRIRIQHTSLNERMMREVEMNRLSAGRPGGTLRICGDVIGGQSAFEMQGKNRKRIEPKYIEVYQVGQSSSLLRQPRLYPSRRSISHGLSIKHFRHVRIQSVEIIP